MRVPSLRVCPGQNRQLVLDGQFAEYQQVVEASLEQDPFRGVIKLAPLVSVPAQRFELGYNFFSPEQLQAANNCSAIWGQCYDDATLAHNFWVVRREEKRIMDQVDAIWAIPMGPDRVMQIQWRRRVWLEVLHWFHLQRCLRWGLPAPRPLDPATFDIPQLDPDAPPPEPPASETRAFTAPLPHAYQDTDDTFATAPTGLYPSSSSTGTGVAVPSSSSVPAASTSSVTVHESSSAPIPSASYTTLFPNFAAFSEDKFLHPSGLSSTERRSQAVREDHERRRKAQRRTLFTLRDTLPPIRLRPVTESGEATTSFVHDDTRQVSLRAPLSTPTIVAGPSSAATSTADSTPTPEHFHLDVLTAALKRALPHASVTASCRFLTEEVGPNALARQHATLNDLEVIAERFRRILAEIITEYRDLLRMQESAMLTQWEDKRRSLDLEDAAFDERIHRTLGLGSPVVSAPSSRYEGSYWIAPASSAGLRAPPPSLVGPGVPPPTVSDSPPPLVSIDPTPINSPSSSSSILAQHGSLSPPVLPSSVASYRSLAGDSLQATILQYDTACRVDWKNRGRRLEFDVSAGDSNNAQGPPDGGGPILFDEVIDAPGLPVGPVAQQDSTNFVWDMPSGDVVMSETDDEEDQPDLDDAKVIASSFYQDLACEISVDAPMDRALVRALETIDAATEANILNRCINDVFEALSDSVNR